MKRRDNTGESSRGSADQQRASEISALLGAAARLASVERMMRVSAHRRLELAARAADGDGLADLLDAVGWILGAELSSTDIAMFGTDATDFGLGSLLEALHPAGLATLDVSYRDGLKRT